MTIVVVKVVVTIKVRPIVRPVEVPIARVAISLLNSTALSFLLELYFITLMCIGERTCSSKLLLA